MKLKHPLSRHTSAPPLGLRGCGVTQLTRDGRTSAMQNDDFDRTDLERRTSDEVRPEPERRAGSGIPAASGCRRCGGEISGRRRNGWCGDACRMADRREDGERRRRELLDTITTAVEKLRREVLS